MADDLAPETLLQHAHRTDPRDSNIVPPIYQASTFGFESSEAMADAAQTPRFESFYTRYGNPNQGDVARVVAAIEGAQNGLVTASGMGAITATAMALLRSGDHVIVQRAIYTGTRWLFNDTLSRFGISVTYVEQEDSQAFSAAIRDNTKLFMLETPSNPLLGITDICEVSRIAHEAGALVTVDNTIASPINQQPLLLGADLVIHSATKYLGGHSDLIAGVVAGARYLIDRIWQTHITLGASLGPIDAWLLLRGLRTLDMRVRRHNSNAQSVAQYLARHPAVSRVFYPGLRSHPQHELAARQMRGFGGLVSFELGGGLEAARRVFSGLQLFRNAVSLGGVESLAAQPAAMWHETNGHAQASGLQTSPSMIRLSVGIENPDDLISDLEQALAREK
ncbi:MAG: aminotransferase class I/II-fold pyridoxal phosphate-dependent enzyme [Candidatus Eremiobacteraeota bacterium]|nr:aminotransferase class I/II-fold pyridoxal phosphate-dependent enzyme [Candidatus Eremiobacteraeota bacterium]